ncbi:MAG: hypothetical protein ACE5E4_10935, partial [Candidatus Binatia bacterium]
CDDGNACTDDLCDPAVGCVAQGDDSNSCDNGNPFDDPDRCTAGVCAGSGGCSDDASCDDGNGCTVDLCLPSGACHHANAAVACDDGDACTTGESCSDGACVGGSAVICDDGNACTDDLCDPAVGCRVESNTAACDDGLFCTVNDLCLDGACRGGTPRACSDGVDCTFDDCDEMANSCGHGADDGFCDDGLFCNGVERCDAVEGCNAGTLRNCIDEVACTVDLCDEEADSCSNIPSDVACDDGMFCNGEESCDPTAGCQPGVAPMDCAFVDSACGSGLCSEESLGCTVEAINEGLECDDGDPLCTVEDRCVGGACAGTPVCDPECSRCDGGQCSYLCGNPYQRDRADITVTDALYTLRAAVALDECPLCICDVDNDGDVSAQDALTILRGYVGLEVVLECPVPAY